MKKVILKIISLIVCGAILLLCFAGCTEAPQKREAFRVTAYVRGEFIQSDETLHPEDFDIITDVILFECASFNNKGEIVSIIDYTKVDSYAEIAHAYTIPKDIVNIIMKNNLNILFT